MNPVILFLVHKLLNAISTADMKMTAFCDVALCSLIDIDKGFRHTASIALIMEEVHTSETWVHLT
jgi:hypothetical protein